MNLKNKALPIILILGITILSVFGYLDSKSKKEAEIIPESIGIEDTSKVSNIETSHILYRLEDNKNYFFLKDLNYSLMMFFNNINNNKYDEINLNLEYIEFFNLSDQYLKRIYEDFTELYYDIISIKKVDDYYLINTRYREDNSDEMVYKVFSISGNYIIDEPFLGVKDINALVEYDKYNISLVSKAKFDDCEVYRVDIKNKTTDTLVISPDMYGFYAKKENNKYYYSLVGEDKLGLDIFPGENRTFYIKFDVLNPSEIYVNINGEDIKIN